MSVERIVASLRERVPAPIGGVPHGGRGYSMSVTWEEIIAVLEALDSAEANVKAWEDKESHRGACCMANEKRADDAEADAELLAASLHECLGTGTIPIHVYERAKSILARSIK